MARLEQQMIQIKKTTDALADTIFSAVLLVQKAAEQKADGSGSNRSGRDKSVA